jgi:S-adenosylmethionine-diacylgycerolhomoserine-N-methlytransferase
VKGSIASHMDHIYRHQRHIYDASRKFYLLGRDDLIGDLQPPEGGKVLEIGCGTARNLIRSAGAYPSASFYGVDVSEQMLATAKRSISRRELDARVHVAHGDASNFDSMKLFGVPSFERVLISYALSMIPPWKEALDHALDLVSATGSLHIIDFGKCEGLPIWFRDGLKRWLGLFSVEQRVELEEALAQLSSQRSMTYHSSVKLRGYAVYAIILSYNSSRPSREPSVKSTPVNV